MRSNSFSKQHQATGPPQQYFTAVEEQEPHSNELTANATATTFFQNAAASPTGSRQDFTAAEGQEAYSNEMTAADDVTTISFQNNDAAVEEKEAHSSTNEPASFVTTPPSPDAFNDMPVAVRVFAGTSSINENGLDEEGLFAETQAGGSLNDHQKKMMLKKQTSLLLTLLWMMNWMQQIWGKYIIYFIVC